MNNLYQQTNYMTDVDYLISTYIREYDISKANINILYKYGVINKQQYDTYNIMNRNARQISIGLLLRDNPQVNDILKNGIMEAKRMLFEANNIQEEDVLCIKNDAVFIINKIPTITKFDNIEFSLKNVYTSFYKLGETELYYFFDLVSNNEKLDVKGINDMKLLLHEEFFIEFLKVTFNSAQCYPIQDTIDIVTTFYTKYIQLQLECGYYREFNNQSMFRLKDISNYYSSYGLESITEEQKTNLDITYNLNLIRELHQIYSGLYFSRRK